MLRGEFEPGTIVKHFKRDMFNAEGKEYLYVVIGTATDVNTGTEEVVYRELSGDRKLWMRDHDEFYSPVDKEKYPQAKQFWRFEDN